MVRQSMAVRCLIRVELCLAVCLKSHMKAPVADREVVESRHRLGGAGPIREVDKADALAAAGLIIEDLRNRIDQPSL